MTRTPCGCWFSPTLSPAAPRRRPPPRPLIGLGAVGIDVLSNYLAIPVYGVEALQRPRSSPCASLVSASPPP